MASATSGTTGTVPVMGMDLTPQHDVDCYHFNFSGWQMIGGLLTDLGCNTSEMAATNDGDPVSCDTAHTWGVALRDALKADTIVEVRVANKLFADGWQSHLRTRDAETARPVLAVAIDTSMDTFALSILLGYAQMNPDIYLAVAELADKFDPVERQVLELDDDSRIWLAAAATFFIDSGGFAQH